MYSHVFILILTFAQARKNIPIYHIQTSINLYTRYKPNKTANKTTMGKNKKHSCIFLFFPFVVLLTEHQSTRERRHRKRTLTSTPFSFQLASSWRTASRSLWWLFRPASSSSRWPSSRPWAPWPSSGVFPSSLVSLPLLVKGLFSLNELLDSYPFGVLLPS